MTRLRTVQGACFAICALASAAPGADEADKYLECSAYFFMAANAKAMAEFNDYYTAGEYAYNRAVRAVGESHALERFNAASSGINELIGRNWIEFKKADDQYGVVCADILRDATTPDR
jgi:hypothetical protein